MTEASNDGADAPAPGAGFAGVLLIPLPDRTPLRITGADRIPFLHGQLSSDVRSLAVGGWQRTLQLDHKGHVLASAGLFVRDDDVYLDVDAGGGALADSLRRHIVFDQVEVDDLSGTLAALALVGSGVPALLADLGLEAPAGDRFVAAELAGASVLLAPAPWSGAPAAEIHLLERDRAAGVAALVGAGARRANPDIAASLRLAAGYATAADAGPGVLPQEIGLDGAVSYRKGCYLGQEIMARIEARGSLRRGPARLTLDRLPTAGERDLVVDGRKVGRLGAAVERDGAVGALAALRTDLDPASRPSVGGATVVAVERL